MRSKQKPKSNNFFTLLKKFLFPKTALFAILNSLIISGIFCCGIYALAANPIYTPGETLDPECLPTNTDCTVASPITSYSGGQTANSSRNGFLSSGDYTTFNSKANYSFGSNNFSGTGNFVTTGGITGTSFTIGANTISSFANLASLAGLSYASNGFVKMTGANTFTLDTNTYASLNGSGYITSDILETLNADYYVNETGPELIVNGTLENWTSSSVVSDWNCSNYINQSSWGTLERVTDVYAGNYAAKITTGSVITSFTPYISIATNITVTPGETYVYSFYTKGDGTHAGTYGIYDITHGSYITGFGYSTSTGVTGTTWTKVSRDVVVPAGCTQIRIQFGGNMFNTGSVVYFDNVSFVQKAVTTNYNGLAKPLNTILNNFPAVAVEYDGTVSGLSSTNVQDAIDEILFSIATLPVDAENINAILNVDYYPETLGTNLLTSNPGFETGAISPWGIQGSANGSYTIQGTTVHTGSYALYVYTDGTVTYNPQLHSTNTTVVAGSTYRITAWIRGDGSHNVGWFWRDISNGATHVIGSTGVSASSWTEWTYDLTIPTGCTSLYLAFYNTQVAGAYFYLDDVSIQLISHNNANGVATSLQTILENFPASGFVFDNSTNGMTSTNIQDAIEEAYTHVSSINFTPRIILPDEVTAVVGDKLQLFTRGIIEAQDPYYLPYNQISSVGSSYPRYYEYTPVLADVGTKTFTMEVKDSGYTTLTTDNMNVVVVNPTGAPTSNKNILCVGDSLTTGGTWPAEFYRRLTQSGGTPAGLAYSNITFIGDNPMPGYTTTQAFTGWGGWTWQAYTGATYATYGHVLTGTFDKDKTDVGSTYTDGTNSWIIEYAVGGLKVHGSATLASSGTLTWVSGGVHHTDIVYTAKTDEPQSPFWTTGTGRFSFADWATRNGYSTIDEAYILLGWNGLSQPNKYLATDHATMVNTAKVFLDKLHSDFPNCKVRIIGLQMPSVTGGLGASYGATSDFTKTYSVIRSVNGLRLAYQSLANEASYSSWVRYLDLASQFDSEYNMPYTATAVNSRSSTTENLGTNGVHPAAAGYYQIADVVYRDFVRTECSD